MAGADIGLRERESELDQIAAAVGAVGRGEGGLLVVEGPAGIGKSTLLQGGRRMAADAEIPCLVARGSELELRYPFGLAHQLFDDHVHGVGEAEREALFAGPAAAARPVFTDGDSSDATSPDVLHQRLNGLTWLARRIAGERPLILCCDDVHWADDPSLHLLAFLAKRVDRLPILLMVGTRPAAAAGRSALTALANDASAIAVRPPPLSDAAVQGWIAGTLGDDADETFLEACQVATGGVPFLVGELLREVGAERLRPNAANARRVGALGAEGISSVVTLRLGSLPPDCARLARALSVLGDRTSLETVAALAELSEEDAGEAAAALLRAGIVDTSDGIAFTHPLMRTTIHEGMGPAERSAAHGRAAAMLRARNAPLDEVAAHLLLTSARGDAAVVDVLVTAARRAAAVGALASACAYLERAVGEPPPEADTATVLTELGRVEGRLGHPGAPARLEEAMAAAAGPEPRATAALELARILKFGGRGAPAVDVLQSVEGDAAGLDEDLREMLTLELLGLGWLSAEARSRLHARIAALQVPAEVRTPLDAFVLAALAFDTAATGQSASLAAERAAQAAASGMLALDPAGPGGYGLLLAAVALMWSDRLVEAEQLLERMLREARRTGNRLSFVSASSMLGLVDRRRGALLAADRDAQACFELGRDIAGNAAFLTAAWSLHGDVAVDRGLPAPELRDRLVALKAVDHDEDALPYGLVLHARARLELALGDHAAAIASLRACGRRETDWGAVCPAVVPWRSTLSGALLAAGEADEARLLAAEEVELARCFGAGRALGIALGAVARTAPRRERPDLLAEAVDVLEASPARLEHARALAALGADLAERGDAGAQDALERAAALASECGARGVVVAAREALDGLAGRTGDDGAPERASEASSREDVSAAVREALRDLQRPHRLAMSPLARSGGSLDERAADVESLLREAADRAFGDDPSDQLRRSVLFHGYFEPSTSHEEAASSLHVSRATYFRRLREATEMVTEFVIASRDADRSPVLSRDG